MPCLFGFSLRQSIVVNPDNGRKSFREPVPRPARRLDGVQAAGVQRQASRVCKQASYLKALTFPAPPEAPLRLRAINAVHGSHTIRLRRLDEKVALLAAGPGHGMADFQHAVALYALSLHAHSKIAPATDDVPLPVGADPGFLVFRESAQVNHIRMAAPQFQEIALGDGLFAGNCSGWRAGFEAGWDHRAAFEDRNQSIDHAQAVLADRGDIGSGPAERLGAVPAAERA